MMHTTRRFCVSEAGTAEELAEKLTSHSWTCCSAFRLGRYLFLNDATHEDGAPEYAVVKSPESPGQPFTQVESITFGWCDYREGLDYIRRTTAGEFDGGGTVLPALRLESAAQHGRCHNCA